MVSHERAYNKLVWLSAMVLVVALVLPPLVPPLLALSPLALPPLALLPLALPPLALPPLALPPLALPPLALPPLAIPPVSSEFPPSQHRLEAWRCPACREGRGLLLRKSRHFDRTYAPVSAIATLRCFVASVVLQDQVWAQLPSHPGSCYCICAGSICIMTVAADFLFSDVPLHDDAAR